MSTETYTVAGMTCDHCGRSISAEVSAVAGVTPSTSTWPPARSP